MQFKQAGKNYFVFVEKEEPVMATLTQFCADNGIRNARISGIGAVKDIEIGAYDLPSKSYVSQTFAKIHELISFEGNVTLRKGEPFIHAHLIIGNHDLELRGGHLFEMKIAVVGEFILTKINTNVRRELNPEIGLATWCLNE